MAEIIKRAPWGLITFVAQGVLMALIYLHSVSVKASIREELRGYVTREEATIKEKSNAELSTEVLKRIDGRLEDIVKRLDRIETKKL